MNAQQLTEATNRLTYPSSASHPDKGERKAARDTYYTERSALERQWRDWLHKEHAPGFPAELDSLVFQKAWGEGHSSGYHEVENIYENLTEFVTKAISIHRRS